MTSDFVFTSESVTEGHPDKICDQISDRVLDECLKGDAESRVACEVMCSKNQVILAGEITTNVKLDYKEVVCQTIKDIGYTDKTFGLDYKDISILEIISKQSLDIAQGVNENNDPPKPMGAGDQGLMFGYATNETPSLMPAPIYYAHLLAQTLTNYRKKKLLSYLRPDGKTQVTVQYVNNKPVRIDTVVISAQHAEDAEQKIIKKDLKQLAYDVLPKELLDKDTIFFINPTGRFVLGGPASDCGITGRKIIVDTYGGMGRHGGGSFSGKDASKVDRSASYIARYIAKNIVAAGLAKECELQIAYAIGVDRPVSVNVNTFGTSCVDEGLISSGVRSLFPLTPKWIIETLDLKKPIFSKTSCYGHFGRMTSDFKWEALDLVDILKREIYSK